jgi:hypothetical protein
MNFSSTLQLIESSKEFKDFIKQNPKAELVAGFFILDFQSNNNQQSLDYKILDKIFTFSLNENNKITLTEDELIKIPNPQPLNSINKQIKTETNELRAIAEIKAVDSNIKSKFEKIIAVLQNHRDNCVWHLTCMLEGFVILDVLIDADTGKVLKFEKRNLMEFMKKK